MYVLKVIKKNGKFQQYEAPSANYAKKIRAILIKDKPQYISPITPKEITIGKTVVFKKPKEVKPYG